MRMIALAAGILWLAAMGGEARAQALPGFDFTRPDGLEGWQATHDVAPLQATPEGMRVEITGGDPYLVGPARDYPAGQLLWMRLRLKSDTGGGGQLFYFDRGAAEEHSVRFPVRAGAWQDLRVAMPALGPGYRLRIDPPGTSGACVIASLSFEARTLLKEPAWPKPTAPVTPTRFLPPLRSGHAELSRNDGLGGFVLSVAGVRMAIGNSRPLIGYLLEGKQRWLDVSAKARVSFGAIGKGFRATTTAPDADGATWRITRTFAPAATRGAFDVRTEVWVDRERSVVYLPMVMVHPGVGTFGGARHQGVFAGLEYLDKPDTSSSEADIIGPGAKRQVPDTLRITFPLMAIQASDRYVGLIWERAPHFSALFDSPDRLFRSGGHAMGVLFPGSDGVNRVEGNRLPYLGETLKPGRPLTLRATLIGGWGKSVVPAVQQYVALRGLPAVPDTGMSAQQYARMAAGGWLDSKIREEWRYRHAYWPGISGFAPQPAADAPLFMEWAARQAGDEVLAARLREGGRQALAGVAPANYDAAGVSHVRYPASSLLFGHAAENAARARQGGRATLNRFESDGSLLYRKATDRPDFGSTHFAKDANGLAAPVVASVLQSALLSGDRELAREGLRLLHALDKFADSVPRGAQTWEVPLHTPDILASAHLVRAYVMGYELTGDERFMDQARYWAWTGVPFVYLVNPTDQPVGPYATIAVLGATHWKAPNWMGLPVQWCGLVYADALYRLVRHDTSGPWQRLADGIAASGIQQSWTADDPDLQGLLPDSYNLRPQSRNPVAINPGTVQAPAIRLFGGPEVYDYHVSRANGVAVHAPGALAQVKDAAGRLSFVVKGWVERPYSLLVTGLAGAPKVSVDGKDVPLAEPHQFVETEGILVLSLSGSPRVEISVPAPKAWGK